MHRTKIGVSGIVRERDENRNGSKVNAAEEKRRHHSDSHDTLRAATVCRNLNRSLAHLVLPSILPLPPSEVPLQGMASACPSNGFNTAPFTWLG